jgi:NAD(P)-dependent dehydrogenase (short-subunit alcohol dehydrogenase family)
MGKYDGQVIWITGGGTGIGLACAVEWARGGAKVAVSGRRVEKLTDAVEAINEAGGEGLAVACDVTDEEACRAAVAAIVDKWGRLDVAVANAGFALAGYVSRLSTEDWRRQFEINLFGVVHTVYAALPELEKTRGRIALVSSVAGYISPPKMVLYASTKHAVRAFGEGLSLELKRSGVSVTTLCPGYVKSDLPQVNNDGVFDPTMKEARLPIVVPADRAARQIVGAVQARKVVAPITGHGAAVILLARFFPRITRMLLARF